MVFTGIQSVRERLNDDPQLTLDILFPHTAGFNPGDKEVRVRDLQQINTLFTKLNEEGMRME